MKVHRKETPVVFTFASLPDKDFLARQIERVKKYRLAPDDTPIWEFRINPALLGGHVVEVGNSFKANFALSAQYDYHKAQLKQAEEKWERTRPKELNLGEFGQKHLMGDLPQFKEADLDKPLSQVLKGNANELGLSSEDLESTVAEAVGKSIKNSGIHFDKDTLKAFGVDVDRVRSELVEKLAKGRDRKVAERAVESILAKQLEALNAGDVEGASLKAQANRIRYQLAAFGVDPRQVASQSPEQTEAEIQQRLRNLDFKKLEEINRLDLIKYEKSLLEQQGISENDKEGLKKVRAKIDRLRRVQTVDTQLVGEALKKYQPETYKQYQQIFE